MDYEIKTIITHSPTEFHALLALNQTEFKDDVRTRDQDATTMIPDQIQQPLFTFEIPRHDVAFRTIWTEKTRKPGVQGYVDAFDSRDKRSRKRRLACSNWTLDKVDSGHGAS